MDEALDYEKVIERVDSAHETPEEAPVSIDLSTAFENFIEEKELRYSDVSALVEGAEVKKIEGAPEAQVQAPAPRQEVPVPKHELGKEMEGAAGKLRGMIGGAGREFEGSVTKEIEKAKEANLVMPTLSMQDQLSDLEKIDEGLGEDVFDKEQIGIIIKEIGALSNIVARQDTSELSDDEKEIALMRDQKVKEIKVRLHMR